MYIINLTYQVPLDSVELYLNDHIEYLNEQYKLGHFLISGRKNPRTGGIILSNISDQSELQKIIDQDPFKKHNIAHYELTEFIASKTSEAFKFLLKQ